MGIIKLKTIKESVAMDIFLIPSSNKELDMVAWIPQVKTKMPTSCVPNKCGYREPRFLRVEHVLVLQGVYTLDSDLGTQI